MFNGLKRKVGILLRGVSDSIAPNHPLITVTIRSNRVLDNLKLFQEDAGKPVAPVLKSNAYGHGLIEIARILEGSVPFFVVDSQFEASALRARGIDTPILVIGYTPVETIVGNRVGNIEYAVTSLSSLKKLAISVKKNTRVHLKIDTGMHRQGILPEEISEAKNIIKSNTNISSHLASVDRGDQLNEWKKVNDSFSDSEFPNLKWRHVSATDGHGLELDGKIPGTTMTRLGLGLYLGHNAKNPVLSMTTVVSGVKRIQKGDRVGYDGTFIAPKDMTIATIPVGYFEGVDRRLSDVGVVEILNQEAPIIGRVSMNISTVDVSDIQGEIDIGTKVTVISDTPQSKNSIENIAKICKTIPYEILVHIPAHLKRIVIGA
jgi:alanine racemase